MSAIFSSIATVAVVLIALLFVWAFAVRVLQPIFADIIDTPIAPKYIPCVAVSASLDGGRTYNENNLKRIPQRGVFFLKFDVSIRRRGLYIKDETFNLTFENTGADKLEAIEAVEYSGKKSKLEDTFNFTINVSKYTGKNNIIFRCQPPTNCIPNTLGQISITSDEKNKLEPLDRTIALVFDSNPNATSSSENKSSKVSIQGELEITSESSRRRKR
jgi:hypothetical protein